MTLSYIFRVISKIVACLFMGLLVICFVHLVATRLEFDKEFGIALGIVGTLFVTIYGIISWIEDLS